jgi:cytochrome c-type protein NapC
MNKQPAECSGMICRLWQALKSPSMKYSLGFIIVIVFAGASVFWIGFHWAMDATNTEEFCISCHEMENFVFEEYKQTTHYSNRTGVRATCPDCHVPKEWHHKIVRKIQSTNELMHKLLGSISTPEKYEAKRLQLAERVWANMLETDSRECRNCHDYDSMDYVAQGRRAVDQHTEGFDQGKTCIDCHKGIAHQLPDMYEEDPSAVLMQH